jgi:hypothetical protein
MPDIGLLKQHQTELEKYWSDAEDYRSIDGYWAERLRRKEKIDLGDDLKQYVGDGQVLSSLLESEAILRKQILEIDWPRVDVIALEKGERAKKDAEDTRLWFARQMADLEDRYDVRGVNSEGQITKGAAHWAIDYEAPPPPPEDWAEEPEDWFRQWKKEWFRLRKVPWGAVRFWPLDNPTYAIEDVEVPYLEWKAFKKGDKHLSYIELGKLAFVGEVQAPESTDDSQMKKIRLCTHAYQVPGTDDWKVQRYAYPEGGKVDDGEVWEEYDSPCGCPYEFCPAGSEMPSERNPHYRWRPDLNALYVTVRDMNFWNTTLTALAVRAIDERRIVVKLSGLHPDLASRIEGLGYRVEGAGAERAWVWRGEDTAPGELRVVPDLMQVPSDVPDAMIQQMVWLREQATEEKTSRFLSGRVSEAEITQGTASAITGQTQQSALPASVHLHKQKQFWQRLLRKMQRLIVYWGEGRQYPVIATGDERMTRGKAEPGTEVMIDAEKMGRSIEIIVSISNLTEQERAEKDARAWYKFDRGVLDEEQLLDEIGFEDPARQKRVINKRNHLDAARVQFAAALDAERAAHWSAVTGLNLAAMGTGQQIGGMNQAGNAPPPAVPPPTPNGFQPPNITGPQTPQPVTPSGSM